MADCAFPISLDANDLNDVADDELVLGGVCFLHRLGELHQHCLLVPLLLCLQVCFPPLAGSPSLPVSHRALP